MYISSLSIQNKSKSVIILLTLFFVMMGSCSLQKIISGDLFTSIEIVKQPKYSAATNNEVITCFLNSEIKEAALLSMENPNGTNQILPFILLSTILGLFINRYKDTVYPKPRTDKNSLVSPIPLFLKYLSFVI